MIEMSEFTTFPNWKRHKFRVTQIDVWRLQCESDMKLYIFSMCHFYIDSLYWEWERSDPPFYAKMIMLDLQHIT